MTINVKMSWHKKKQLLHDKYKKKKSMMKKLRCGNISFAKVALKRARKYSIKSRARKCAHKRFRYSLSEPKPFAKNKYIQNIKKVVSCDMKFMKELKDIFKTQQSSTYEKMSKWRCRQTFALLASQRLVNRGIQLRKHYVSALLKAVKKICELDINDFGEGVHSVSSEPYYYESAYDFDFEPGVMVADSCGQCYYKDMKYVSGKTGGTWKCTAKCKALTQFEVDTVLEFKSYFEKSLHDVMSLLSMCDDDCPYIHHSKICDINESDVQRKGHSVLCYDGSECKSRLRILRLASCHYPVLRGFLNNVYLARSSHLKILKLDEAFSKGDFKFIMEACRIPIDSIFSNVVEGTQEGAAQECELRKPDLELRLQAENNKAIAEYRKAVEDYPKNVCCSCQELHQRKNVTVVKFDNHLGTAVWPLLKQFMLQKNPKAAGETHFMCSYCKNLIKKDQMPSRCVLNGLQVVEIPAELSGLDCLSKQFIQRAKAYQTVVQLGTYTAKVPMYNSLKACKGVMFFLPLPLEKTLDTFDEVDNNVSLASPELYIIVKKKKISHSEYIKSRLLNKDSRFRKDPRYVFYLLWHKELREVSAGVYNLLKSHKARPMSASSLIDRLQLNDELLETNLSTMLQTVRGTTQFWFKKQSELRCMVCEFGTPTLFLTFSCAEYDSHDIADYLKTVNNVPEGYDVGKLCTEDPISVSRQFSLKFHAFFNKIIIKGKVLGTVDHYMWKKEYQNRGAPHYHVLLWIQDAPVIGVDDADKVLAWIEDRITCKLPDKESDPELHAMVTKYQLHKCSGYCKRKVKRGGVFVTTCKSNFPRTPQEKTVLHCVEEKLKKRQRIYELARSESEVRVNDYNPLLLLL